MFLVNSDQVLSAWGHTRRREKACGGEWGHLVTSGVEQFLQQSFECPDVTPQRDDKLSTHKLSLEQWLRLIKSDIISLCLFQPKLFSPRTFPAQRPTSTVLWGHAVPTVSHRYQMFATMWWGASSTDWGTMWCWVYILKSIHTSSQPRWFGPEKRFDIIGDNKLNMLSGAHVIIKVIKKSWGSSTSLHLPRDEEAQS